MMFFRVYLNRDHIASVGGPEFDVLTFGLLRAAGARNPVLQLDGMSKAQSKHYQWVYRTLTVGDKVRLVVTDVADGLQSSESGGGLAHKMTLENGNCVAIIVTLPKGDKLKGTADSQQNLQVTATWTRISSKCALALGGIHILDDSQRETWFETSLVANDEISFEIADV